MNAILIHRSGSLNGQVISLTHDVTRLGRKPDNHIVFNDERVSSNHAEIHRSGSRCYLVDLGSTNGTFVNGEAIHKTPLKNRDKIEMGEGGPMLEFRFEAGEKTQAPIIRPLSGSWEKGLKPIPLEHSRNTLGRGLKNNIVVGRVPNPVVSVRHAVLAGRSGIWEIEDTGSSNGTYVNGEPVRKTRLRNGDRVELGKGGPVFEFQCSSLSGRQKKDDSPESERILRKLEKAAKGGRAGEQTMVLLQAAQKYYKRRRWPLLVASGVILAAALATGYLLYKEKQRNAALSEFYSWRTIDAQLVRDRADMTQDRIAEKKEREKAERDYEQFLDKLGFYKGKTPQQKAIIRLAQRLGETALEMPPGFYQATADYINIWKNSSRLKSALDRARRRKLPQIIGAALDVQGLPRELLYIPLQESGYNNASVGPKTRFGIAKGLWQMIPSTARDYELKLGPLKDVREYDPSDERHDEFLSTNAAVRYLAFLYSTKAAASGLLVMASYNFGQTRIIDRLDKLPNNPRQRSFWNFYNNGWIPEETRDYVMKIFSAALICENPGLFQMDMEPFSENRPQLHPLPMPARAFQCSPGDGIFPFIHSMGYNFRVTTDSAISKNRIATVCSDEILPYL
jgi:membrane-bound lytic murein transglycosylase D